MPRRTLYPMTQEHIAARIGRALRAIRQKMDWRQGPIAERIGISRVALYRAEGGHTHLRLKNLLGYCQALGVSLNDVQAIAESIYETDRLVQRVLALSAAHVETDDD